jgi:chitinase
MPRSFYRLSIGSSIRLLSLLLIAATTAGCGSGTSAPSTSTPHSVQLKWSGNTGANGYIVYRRHETDFAFVPLNSIPVTTSSFTDSNVQSGNRLLYCVTSVGADGMQSEASDEVLAIIP